MMTYKEFLRLEELLGSEAFDLIKKWFEELEYDIRDEINKRGIYDPNY